MKSNLPVMPEDMHPRCKKWWRRLLKVANTSTLLPCDEICLELACMSLATHEKMAEDVKKRDGKVINIDDKKMLSNSKEIITMSFNQLQLSQDARNTLMGYMPL